LQAEYVSEREYNDSPVKRGAKLAGCYQPGVTLAARRGETAMTDYPPRVPRPSRHWTRVLAEITNMTGMIAGSVSIFSWLGYKAGRRFGHETGFILLGFSIGVFIAFLSLWRFVKKQTADD
jgi:hypothetical protein